MGGRFTTRELNSLFIEYLGEDVLYSSDLKEKPLLVDIKIPYLVRLRVYLYNCTNPPGGRSPDEYKSQIIVPGQLRGTRGNFDFSNDRIVLLGAYACLGNQPDEGVFVLWDAMFHTNFSYSANIQIKSDVLIAALNESVAEGKRSNNEIVLTARPKFLKDAIIKRIESITAF